MPILGYGGQSSHGSSIREHDSALSFDPRIYIILLFIWTALTVSSLGVAPLFDYDEAAHAEVAAEMPRDNTWLLPALNGRPFYEKPAPFFYFISASFALFGKTAFAARLPSALFTLATALFLHHAGRRLGRSELGMFAALIYVSMLMPALLAHTAILDPALNFWMTVSIMSFFLWHRQGLLRDAVLSMLAAGIAVSVKGPVGLMIPLIVILLDRFAAKDLVQSMKRFPWKWGVPAFLSGALPWYALVSIVYGPGFLRQFILVDNVGRFTHAVEGHSGCWYYYFLVLIPSALPWLALLPWWVRQAFVLRNEQHAPGDLSRFGLVWTLVVVVFFSVSRTKLPHYISSVYPAMALGMAALWHRQRPSPAWMRAASWTLLVSCLPVALTLMALPTLYPFFAGMVTHPWAVAALSPKVVPGHWIAGFVVTASLLTLHLLARHESAKRALVVLVIFGFVLQASLIWSLAPWAGRLVQSEQLEIAAIIRTCPTAEPVYSLVKRPSISFYSGRSYIEAGSEVLERLASSSSSYLLVAHKSSLAELSRLRLETIVHGDNYVLLRHAGDTGH